MQQSEEKKTVTICRGFTSHQKKKKRWNEEIVEQFWPHFFHVGQSLVHIMLQFICFITSCIQLQFQVEKSMFKTFLSNSNDYLLISELFFLLLHDMFIKWGHNQKQQVYKVKKIFFCEIIVLYAIISLSLKGHGVILSTARHEACIV